MKKLLLVFLVSLGLQTQAQLVCATGWLCTVDGDTTFIRPYSSVGANSQTWSMSGHYTEHTLDWGDGSADTTFIGVIASGTSTAFQTMAHIYTPGFIGYANLTTTFYDSLTNNLVCTSSIGWGNYVCTPIWTGINELTLESINDNKMYDLLGRELTTVPVGTMYIRNRKLYLLNINPLK